MGSHSGPLRILANLQWRRRPLIGGVLARICCILLPLYAAGARFDTELVLDALEESDVSNQAIQNNVSAKEEGHLSDQLSMFRTSCYCWRNPLDPASKLPDRVTYFSVIFRHDKHERCLKECGPYCKRQIQQLGGYTSTFANSSVDPGFLAVEKLGYAYTCHDDDFGIMFGPNMQKCGLYIVELGGENGIVFTPPLESCEKIANRLQPYRLEADQASRRVAILADYDHCWDIISHTNSGNKYKSHARVYAFLTGFLTDALKSITRGKEGKVSLFVGSIRQSDEVDRKNIKREALRQTNDGNGRALGRDGAYDLWIKLGIEGVPSVDQWNLAKTLLADVLDRKTGKWANGDAWDDNRAHYDQRMKHDCYLKQWKGLEKEELKCAIADNSIRYLQLPDAPLGTGPVDLFFFDDKLRNIDYVLHNAKVPEDWRLFIVHYDYAQYVDDVAYGPLQAIGINERFLLWPEP